MGLKARARLRPLGLHAYLTAYPGARLAKLSIPAGRDRQSGGGKRGTIAEFSRSSRRRMLEKLHTIRRDAPLPHFVTLTFPDFFPDQQTAKRRLDSWLKRVRRRWPKTAGLWRMEVIDRKSGTNKGQVAPHFHLLLWGTIERDEAARMWCAVNGTDGDYAHLRHGADVKALEDWRGVGVYCSKYMAKGDGSEYEIRGRVWGVHNKASLPVAEPVRVALLPRAAWRIRREVRARVRSTSPKARAGATVFASVAEAWVERAHLVNEERLERANRELQIVAAEVYGETNAETRNRLQASAFPNGRHVSRRIAQSNGGCTGATEQGGGCWEGETHQGATGSSRPYAE